MFLLTTAIVFVLHSPHRDLLPLPSDSHLPMTATTSPSSRPTTRSAALRPVPRSMRSEEDWGALRDPKLRTEPFDRLKFLPLTPDEKTYLSFGGDIRLTYEFYDNDKWGSGPQDNDGFFLQRYMVHADIRSNIDNMQLRFFGQLISALENAREGGPRSSDEDELDVHQAFAEFSLTGNGPGAGGQSDRLMLRAGRQQLQFGSGRILSFRNRRNVPNSFEAVLGEYRTEGFRLDAFVFRPVDTNPGRFDNRHLLDESYAGVFATLGAPARGLDLYWLAGHVGDKRYVAGQADERRSSVGTRLFVSGEIYSAELEPRVQFGDFGDQNILAYAVSGSAFARLGKTWSPRLGIEFDVASGDTGDDGELGTYNRLFFRAGYITDISLVSLQNLININPRFDFSPVKDVTVTAECFLYWRYSEDDGVYGSTANVVRRPGLSEARFVGTQPTLSATWQANPHLAISGQAAYFIPGDFIKETGPSDDVMFFRLQVDFQF